MDRFLQQMMHDMQFGRDDGRIEKYTDKDFLVKEIEQILPVLGLNSPNIFRINCTVTSGYRSGHQPKVSLSPANRVGIKELMENADETLDGRFFLCRCITPPCQMSAVVAIVDDPEGKRAVRLALYNYTSEMQVLQVGLVLAIKNPWFKSSMDGGYAVRCDNPADAIILNLDTLNKSFPNLVWKGEIPIKYRSQVSSGASSGGPRRNNRGENSEVLVQELSKKDEAKVDKLKRTGNQSFTDKHFADAIRFYTQALEISPMNIDLLSNRAASLINLGCYNKAMLDIKKVLDQDQYHIKGIYRQVKSLWGLQRYQEAVDFVNMKFGQNSDLKKVKELRLLNQKTLELQKQHETGSFDMVEILKDPTKTSEIAEFMGPVQISKIQGKGRGLVATETIKPGQLLLCSKAFAFQTLDSKMNTTSLSLNFDTKAMNFSGHHDIVAAVVQKLTLEPQLGREFFQLYAGPELGAVSEDDEATQEIDLKRVDQIVQFNRFHIDISISISMGDIGRGTISTKGTGLWIMPSYCNHSCAEANSYWDIFGTFMFIRAVRPIQKGEEILISYTSQHLDYNQREEVFRSHSFKCDCLRCNLEREEGEVIRGLRSDIMKSLEKKMTSVSDLTSAIEGFSSLESLQQKHPKMNLSLAHPAVTAVLEIGLLQFDDLEDHERCLKLLKKAHFVSRETSMARQAVSFSCNILGCYLSEESTDLKVIRKWVVNLKHDLMVAFGSLKPIHIIEPNLMKLLEASGLFFQE